MQAAREENEIYNRIDAVFGLQRTNAFRLRKEPIAKRREKLEKLRLWIHQHRADIHAAAYQDFRKPSAEVDGIEIFHVLQEIKCALDNLDQWTSPLKVDAPWTMLGTRSVIQYEPRGVCLILSPWNYSFSLAIGPLVSAIAAGNTVVIKPSELTPHVSTVLQKLVQEVFEPNVVSLVEGGPETAQHLLTLPFDHIFFTGSPAIGKVVMKAAAEHLTSVTLELGGKSPAIVTRSANLEDAAERIIVTKFVNNGQTCVAPDYLLVDEKIAPALLPLLVNRLKSHFAPADAAFDKSDSYCRIVNDKHFTRLNALLSDAVRLGARSVFSGERDPATRFFHPVILTHVPPHARLLNEEIFGPILPVVIYKSMDDAVAIINDKPKPLALYVFARNSGDQQKILQETSAGGVCINDCGIQFLHHGLPFGGINNSGMGKSHGRYGFIAFSNEKPILKQRGGFTSVKLFYPPYTSFSRKMMDWFLKLF
ncbi:MAG TPA: aldehyde dehydrogenase family protein [Ohtaekwangia sp.]|nr:aldehyde dehydrogenase family protein [Ohtaekwangia sp.]